MRTTPRPLLTQREAASACGVSRSTIRRRREAGELPGCVQDEERGWLIPVEALLAAGFHLNAPAPPEDAAPASPAVSATGPVSSGAVGEDVAALRAELERERQAHLEARHQAELAAAEAGHLRTQLAAEETHIEDLRTALRALAPAPERAAIEQSAHPDAEGRPVGHHHRPRRLHDHPSPRRHPARGRGLRRCQLRRGPGHHHGHRGEARPAVTPPLQGHPLVRRVAIA